MSPAELLLFITILATGLVMIVISFWHGWEVLVHGKHKISPFIRLSIMVAKLLPGPKLAEKLEISWMDTRRIKIFAVFSIITGTLAFVILFFFVIFTLAKF